MEVSQAGIFTLRNIPQGDMDAVLAIACPNILFPYVREVVSDIVVRAGFPPVVLNPVNFESLYQAQRDALATSAAPQIITPTLSH